MAHIIANLPPVKCFVETEAKWALEDTNTVMYERKEEE
jgi:hypothetical protein